MIEINARAPKKQNKLTVRLNRLKVKFLPLLLLFESAAAVSSGGVK